MVSVATIVTRDIKRARQIVANPDDDKRPAHRAFRRAANQRLRQVADGRLEPEALANGDRPRLTGWDVA